MKGSESTRAGWRKEAARLLQELYNAGSYWRSKALQLIDAGIEDPASWAGDGASPFVTYLVAESTRRRGECSTAIGLYEELLRGGDYVNESHYGIGFCAFHGGKHERALAELANYLESAGPDAPYRTQAAYLRFKAAEARHVAGESAGDEYAGVLQSFLDIAPEHDQAFEAWFRLGEWRRDHGDAAGCAEAFARVEGDPAFALKAAFLAAQCATQAATERADETEPDPELVKMGLERVDAFLSRFEPGEEDEKPAPPPAVALPMQAKAVVMGAALCAKAGVGTMEDRLARLEGFEKRFPDQGDLLPEVFSLRIVAYRKLGNLDAAGGELERLLALEDTGEYGAESLKKLGLVFLKEGSSREEDGDAEGARRARRTALRIYERLLADVQAGRIKEKTPGLVGLIKDLEAQVGDDG